MAKISTEQVCALLQPYLGADAPVALCERVQRYVSLLQVWNKKLNLTSVRDPEQMVQRHFGESFFFARLLPQFATLLDVGSGAGFPGIPVSMLRPEADVMLAEGQAKKAVFLREAVWMTGSHARVWGHRLEEMEKDYRFDVVVLRAVEDMGAMLAMAMDRLVPGGTLAFFVGESGMDRLPPAKWSSVHTYDVPLTSGHVIVATLAGGPESSAGQDQPMVLASA